MVNVPEMNTKWKRSQKKSEDNAKVDQKDLRYEDRRKIERTESETAEVMNPKKTQYSRASVDTHQGAPQNRRPWMKSATDGKRQRDIRFHVRQDSRIHLQSGARRAVLSVVYVQRSPQGENSEKCPSRTHPLHECMMMIRPSPQFGANKRWSNVYVLDFIGDDHS